MKKTLAAFLFAVAAVAAACGPGGATQGPTGPQLPNAPVTAGPDFSPTTMPSMVAPNSAAPDVPAN